MPRTIVVVHDDTVFSDAVGSAFRGAGYEVVVFSDPLMALAALEQSAPADILITRTQFPQGKPHGVALAQMVRLKRPEVRILITGKSHLAHFADGVGEFLPHPVTVTEMVAAAERLLGDKVDDDSQLGV